MFSYNLSCLLDNIYTRVSLSVRTDNEAAPLWVQGGGVLVIRTLLTKLGRYKLSFKNSDTIYDTEFF